MNSEIMENKNAASEVVEIMPLVDILDSGDNVTMWFEVPGANAGSVNIEVKDGIMSMSAASSLRRNGKTIVFKRNFQLYDDVDFEKITAGTRDGVLTLNIPKAESARVHKIKVN